LELCLWDWGAEASRGERHLEVNYELAAKKIGNQNTSREYENKETIFRQGDAADARFYIQARQKSGPS
jgi:hypothetical protein